jgi:hypothetical protein
LWRFVVFCGVCGVLWCLWCFVVFVVFCGVCGVLWCFVVFVAFVAAYRYFVFNVNQYKCLEESEPNSNLH